MPSRSVLIIDDSPIIRERLLAHIGRLQGIDIVYSANDTDTAFVKLKKEKPDVAIIDIQLPDGSGIDLLSRIKKENPNAIIIVLTNYPFSIIRRRCIELGADYFFDKSTEFDKVLKVFEELNQNIVV